MLNCGYLLAFVVLASADAKRQAAASLAPRATSTSTSRRQWDRCNSGASAPVAGLVVAGPVRKTRSPMYEFAALHIVCWVTCQRFAAEALSKLFGGRFEYLCSESLFKQIFALISAQNALLYQLLAVTDMSAMQCTSAVYAHQLSLIENNTEKYVLSFHISQHCAHIVNFVDSLKINTNKITKNMKII